jgi:hypothetical protein
MAKQLPKIQKMRLFGLRGMDFFINPKVNSIGDNKRCWWL